jgi:hypothetical protein
MKVVYLTLAFAVLGMALPTPQQENKKLAYREPQQENKKLAYGKCDLLCDDMV